jgi:hypothetical protein
MSPRTRKTVWIAAGIVAANLAGGLIFLLFSLPGLLSGGQSVTVPAWAGVMIFYPSLFLVPMAIGIVAAYFWKGLSLRIWEYLIWWFVTSFLTPLGAYLFFREGLVCLLIGFPILFVCGFAGVVLGRFWFRPTGKMNLSIFPLLFLAMLAEGKLREDRQAVVADRLLIRAPAAEVWKHVVAFSPIETASDYWLGRIGLPSPVATTCEGPFIGADRRCIFSGGLVFKETISELIPEHLLTFDIVEQPPDPELLGHLTLHRGQFELEDNGDGTTTLVGRSWYTLHMRPLWYFDWWTRDITSHVHLRVMEHIKELSEGLL